MLRCGTCYLEMFQYEAPAPTVTKPLDPYDKGYTHFCVDATDIELEYERLKKIGMTFSQPGPIDVGHVKSIYGRDPERSEERRVGKECVSTCRSRWSPYH